MHPQYPRPAASLVKGRWHGEAVTEGFRPPENCPKTGIPQSASLTAPFNKGAKGRGLRIAASARWASLSLLSLRDIESAFVKRSLRWYASLRPPCQRGLAAPEALTGGFRQARTVLRRSPHPPLRGTFPQGKALFYCGRVRSPSPIQPILRNSCPNSQHSTAGRMKQIRAIPAQSMGVMAAFTPVATSLTQPAYTPI